MSETDGFLGRRYEIVAWGRGETPVVYEEFGSYQGDWLLIARAPAGPYHLYKGVYGSCSGCDGYEATFGDADEIRRDAIQVQQFIAEYDAFAEVPIATMHNLCAARTLRQVLPRNSRNSYGSWTPEGLREFAANAEVEIKLREGWPVEASDVFRASNQETRSRVLRTIDVDAFLALPNVTEVDRADAHTRLLSVPHPSGRGEPWKFALVKDASTERRYLLRVPPAMTRVKAAIAWTFAMEEDQYTPVVET